MSDNPNDEFKAWAEAQAAQDECRRIEALRRGGLTDWTLPGYHLEPWETAANAKAYNERPPLKLEVIEGTWAGEKVKLIKVAGREPAQKGE